MISAHRSLFDVGIFGVYVYNIYVLQLNEKPERLTSDLVLHWSLTLSPSLLFWGLEDDAVSV